MDDSNQGFSWPSTYEYAMAHRCSTCKAEPGVPCDAPGRLRQQQARARRLAKWGLPFYWESELELIHGARQDAGARHYYRDVEKAPWPEERIPGQRYDTLATPQEEVTS